MVVAVQHRAASLTADYDRVADVLYVSVGDPRPGFGDDGPDDVILGHDQDVQHPSGVTVPGFQENGWASRKQALAAIIAHHVGVGEAEAQGIIASATGICQRDMPKGYAKGICRNGIHRRPEAVVRGQPGSEY